MLQSLLDAFLTCTGVSTDSRTTRTGELFFALQGPSFDGNAYAKKALARGAKYAVISRADAAPGEVSYVVDDTLLALQDLARAYRRTWTCPVVGLTGSNGKTTTKELLAAALATVYRVHSTAGNFNNHIGVPLTLLRTPANAELAVVEMGANHVGEIGELSAIAEPTHGLITNIGRAHLEGFGGLDGVRRGKRELFDFLAEQGGHAFVNRDDAEVSKLVHPGSRLLFYSGEGAPGQASDVLRGELIQEFPEVSGTLRVGERAQPFTSRLPGVHNYRNLLAAAAIASYFKVPLPKIAGAFAAYQSANQRSEVRTWRGSTLLFDAYNANPDSVAASLAWLASRPEPRKIVVLGELAELGDDTAPAHLEAAKSAAAIPGAEVALFGSAYAKTPRLPPAARVFAEADPLAAWLAERAGSQRTVILLKGSRSNRMEQLL